MIPFWFWFLTTTVALGAIAISSFVVVFMRIEEIDRREHARFMSRRDAHVGRPD